MPNGKKVAIWGCLGCVGFLALTVLLLGGGVAYIAYRGVQFGKNVGQSYREVAAGYKTLNKEHPFTPPEDGVMNADRLEEYLVVRQEISDFSTEYLGKFEEIRETIEDRMESPGIMSKIHGIQSIREIISHGANMGAIIGEEHVRLLEQTEFSLEEYFWITWIYLGTLAKAEENNLPELAEKWNEYIEAFEAAQRDLRNFNAHFGKTRIQGDEVNRDKLLKALEGVVFKPENAEIVSNTIGRFIVEEKAGILDFFVLHSEDIINDLAKGDWDGDFEFKNLEAEMERRIEDLQQEAERRMEGAEQPVEIENVTG